MDISFFPDLLSMLVFLGAFRPLARRAGPRANDWFIAFAFLFVHDFALGFAHVGELQIMNFLAEWSLELAAVAFMNAATWDPLDRQSAGFLSLVILPVLAESALVALGAGPWWRVGTCALMLLPYAWLRLRPSRITPRRETTALAQMVIGGVVALIFGWAPLLAISLMKGSLFVGASLLCWRYGDRHAAGVKTAVAGLFAWGISLPTYVVLVATGVASPTWHALLRSPEYVVAYGVILLLIERYVEETEALALHDPMTGLPNRRLFDDRLEQAISSAPTSGTMLACLVIDVDRFKQINDTLGHLVGDGLLEAIAARLSWHIGIGDTLARTGGDEFSAVLTRLQSLEHLRFVVGSLMSATCVPIVVGDQSLRVGLSIGIALYPQHGTDGDELRRRADDAMYDAKHKGGNQFAYVGGPPDEEAHLMLSVPSVEHQVLQIR